MFSNRHIVILPLATIFFLGIVGVYFLHKDAGRDIYAAELAFSNLSPDGARAGKIIPASCESAYSHVTGGYITPTGSEIIGLSSGQAYQTTRFVTLGGWSGSQILSGSYYCFGNSGGPSQLVPLRSHGEFMSFYNNIYRLPGLYIIY